MIFLGCAGIAGVLANRTRMFFLYNFGLLVIFLSSIGLMIPLILDNQKSNDKCLDNH